VTHLWGAGEPITVQSDAAFAPLSFTWQGRSHPVERIAKRWRLDVNWWQQRIWREYFKVVTHSGLLVVLYRDWLTGEWFLQRLYD
jgi:hypothetical protein